eukprot:GHVL01010959.1.p1 GENE.GHVL01010959.1~~GHVL01010959.1.p1  ORF type:complete len:369 (-),score=86.19 GHVL01010959.1:1963-3069(-)
MSSGPGDVLNVLDNQCIIDVPEDIGAILETALAAPGAQPGRAAVHVQLEIQLEKDSPCLLIAKTAPPGGARPTVDYYRGTALKLPCYIESLKTADGNHFYKSADVSQMIIFNKVADESSNISLADKEKIQKLTFPPNSKDLLSGLTPGTRKIRKRKFNDNVMSSVVTKEHIQKAEMRIWAAKHGMFREDIITEEYVTPQCRTDDMSVEPSKSRVISSIAELNALLAVKEESDKPAEDGKNKVSGTCVPKIATKFDPSKYAAPVSMVGTPQASFSLLGYNLGGGIHPLQHSSFGNLLQQQPMKRAQAVPSQISDSSMMMNESDLASNVMDERTSGGFSEEDDTRSALEASEPPPVQAIEEEVEWEDDDR